MGSVGETPPSTGRVGKDAPFTGKEPRVNLEWQIGLQFYLGYGRLTDGETKAQLETR